MSQQPTVLEVGIRDVTFGADVVVIQPTNLYGCVLGDGVFIGPYTEVQSDARIGARSRIQSHSFVCSYVEIGEDCFVAHGVMFTNDSCRSGKANRDPESWEKTTIGNRVTIGSNATILPVSICDDTVIGAGAVVTKSIDQPGVYVGNPARFLRPLS